MLKYILLACFLCSASALAKEAVKLDLPKGSRLVAALQSKSKINSTEDLEEKRRKEITKRNELRNKNRIERLKTLKKLDCKFDTLGSWKDFLSFHSPVEKPKIEGEFTEYDSGIQRVYFSEIGKITKGPCKSGEILVAKFDYNEPDKSGPGPSYLFADGFLSDDEKFDQEDNFDNFSYKILIKVRNHYISSEYYENYEDPLLSFIMNFQDDALAYGDPKVNYYRYFLPSKKILVRGQTIRINVENFRADPNRILDSDAEKIFDDPNIGKLFLNGLITEMQWPDGLWSPIEIGLNEHKPGYWFYGFLEDLRFKKFGKLKPLAGSPNWFEPNETSEHFLKEEFKKYLARVKSLEERIKETKSFMSHFEFKPLTFSEYKKIKPFLFFKDVLGRTQVHRLSLHEIPALAEPLMYVYGEPRSLIDIKLCQNLKLKRSWPNYNDGWEVEVLDDGFLWDHKNRKKIRTLFWEGFAGQIPPLKNGWVVRPAEVKPLLDRILPLYGLNNREALDFKKYWVPVLTKAPFYRIEIIPSEWIDHICPLSLSPSPSRLIRVYMRAYPQQNFEVVPEPTPPSQAPRPPFTVVEWGGTLE
jgi:hypothetical protein